MNTVLDDSKMLCLSNGQRIQLPSTLTMMFEVQDLKVASPATVSRCGMVYIEPVNLGWEPIVDTWSKKMNNQFKESTKQISIVVKHLKKLVTDALLYMREECKEIIPSVDINLVQSCLNMFNSLIYREEEDVLKITNLENIQILCLIFSFIWSFGANIDDKSRPKFNKFIKFKFNTIYSEFPDNGDIYS